ncbi:phosphate propanoyltransferase [Peptoniphilaceae bacterium SGI.131]
MNEVRNLAFLLIDNLKKNKKENPHTTSLDADMVLPVGVSGRHLHISKAHMEVLFGRDYELTPIKALSQPGQFACKEQLTICGPKGVLENVRIIGPCRKETQVEILQSDAFKLGVKPVIRMSSDLEGTPGITIIGPKGTVVIDKGVIVAQRHIHMNLEQANYMGLENGQIVSVRSGGIRSMVLENIIVRADKNGYLDFHIDMEEANACGLKNGDMVKIIK